MSEEKKSQVAENEEKILSFWQENKIFEKSLDQTKDGEHYVFYDGPPFATGLPHYGHILASTIKDAVPRYQTMNGKYVERRWGWDTHGLPIENKIEEKLRISGKKEIEKIGIETFNDAAREQVLEYAHAWKKTVDRIARWVEFDTAYMTMDNDYVESVWWALGEINKKGLLYKGEKVLPYCPRCETPISNSEIAMDNSYKDIKDISVTVKFELEDEPGTFLLAWTTTPWTLPGNVAAAVNSELEYVKVKKDDEYYILAKDNVESVFDGEVEIVDTQKGSILVGKKYKPIFDYYKDVELKNKENIWKVWDADYVTTEQGTGVVHLAPVYGEEDMELAKKNDLPLIHHVQNNGLFVDEVKDFKGLHIKPKEDHQSTDIEIIKNLAHRGLLFSKLKIDHSYPHCHRCESPLFYNAISAWFIDIQKVKDRALELNQKIHWIPEHLKDGRVAKTMESAPDWNISRNRYWATPLPIWMNEVGDFEVIASREELYNKLPEEISKIFVLRHGESEKNTKHVYDSSLDTYGLTERGEKESQATGKALKEEEVDLVVCSPVRRAKETAEIIAKELGAEVQVADELREMDAGSWEGKTIGGDEIREEYDRRINLPDDEYFKAPYGGGESLADAEARAASFVQKTVKENPGKIIVFVSHQGVNMGILKTLKGWDESATRTQYRQQKACMNFAVPTEVYVDREREVELDLHRPYLDRFEWTDDGGKVMRRIPEVVDCWVESGSMPFAQDHYPFENKEKFESDYPGQFVAEYIAQTRTWFYYSNIMGTILFDKMPFENIVTTGTVLAEDGSKMSKSKNNFPDPWLIFNKYGVDAVRYYLLASPLMKSEDLNFSEQGVDEVYKKLMLRLGNVVSFYEMYPQDGVGAHTDSKNVLDQWIISRSHELVALVTKGMEDYEIDQATRPFIDFADDLSTWYVRRNRDRFRDGDVDAIATTKYVLEVLSKTLAPFTPYLAEDIYKRVGGKLESVHLEAWPEAEKVDAGVLEDMKKIRELISLALEKRASVGMKVRQPLAKLTVTEEVSEEYKEIIKDEVNVKEVVVGDEIALNTELTDDLKKEGVIREFVRGVQALRKTEGLNPEDRIMLKVSTTEEGKMLLEEWKSDIEGIIGLDSFDFTETEGKEIKEHDHTFTVSL